MSYRRLSILGLHGAYASPVREVLKARQVAGRGKEEQFGQGLNRWPTGFLRGRHLDRSERAEGALIVTKCMPHPRGIGPVPGPSLVRGQPCRVDTTGIRDSLVRSAQGCGDANPVEIDLCGGGIDGVEREAASGRCTVDRVLGLSEQAVSGVPVACGRCTICGGHQQRRPHRCGLGIGFGCGSIRGTTSIKL